MESTGGLAPKRSQLRSSEEDRGVDAQTGELLERINEMLAAPAPVGLNRIDAARAKASAIFEAFAGPLEDDGSTQFDVLVEAGAGAVPARVYQKQFPDNRKAPLIVFFHGGGWSLGALSDYDVLLRAISALSGAVIVSVDYRRAPENRFPAAFDDAMAATAYITRKAESFGGDPRRVALMGDSAGGNLAAVVAQQARGDKGPPIAAQFLLYPMLDVCRPHDAYPSRLLFGGGDRFLTHGALDASVADYLDDPALAADPRVSPLIHPDLSGLPPTVIFVGEYDPLRDEAATYEERLRRAGVDVVLHQIPGAIHAFLSFGVLDCARRARRQLAAEIVRVFAQIT